MKTTKKIQRMSVFAAAVLAGFLGSAQAESPTPDPTTHMASTRTRADVVAEVHAARSSGQLAQASAEDSGSFEVSRLAGVAGKTRAEVRAEVLAALASGELQVVSSEDSGSFHFARQTARPDGVRMAAVTR